MWPVKLEVSRTDREVSRVLHAFARVVRARRLYAEGHASVRRMLADLEGNLSKLLSGSGEFELRVGPRAIYYDGDPVLEEANAEDSIPYAFFRDGIRKLVLVEGMEPEELAALAGAAAQALASSGVGEDAVSLLWRADLAHLRYVAVESGASGADGEDLGTLDPTVPGHADVAAELSVMLRGLYGSGGESGILRSLHFDGSELSAKQIAESLVIVDDMAPGLHPRRDIAHVPEYIERLAEELAAESEVGLTARSVDAAIAAVAAPLPERDDGVAIEALLRLFDVAITLDDLELATRMVTEIRHVGRQRTNPKAQIRAGRWLLEATSDNRLRTMIGIMQADPAKGAQVERLLRSAGRTVVPKLSAITATNADVTTRRPLIGLILAIGFDDLGSIRPLIDSPDEAVVADGIFLASQLSTPAARSRITDALDDPRALVRCAAIEAVPKLGPVGVDLLAHRVRDPVPAVRVAAARSLAAAGGREAAKVIAEVVRASTFEAEPLDVKTAFLECFAITNDAIALAQLERYLKQADNLLLKKEQEELALGAISALAFIRSKRTIEVLKNACSSRRRRVAEAARDTLARMKAARP